MKYSLISFEIGFQFLSSSPVQHGVKCFRLREEQSRLVLTPQLELLHTQRGQQVHFPPSALHEDGATVLEEHRVPV